MAHNAFKSDIKFKNNLDLAVIECRRKNPEKNTTRSSFMREAVERAMLEYGVAPLPKIRTRT